MSIQNECGTARRIREHGREMFLECRKDDLEQQVNVHCSREHEREMFSTQEGLEIGRDTDILFRATRVREEWRN